MPALDRAWELEEQFWAAIVTPTLSTVLVALYRYVVRNE